MGRLGFGIQAAASSGYWSLAAMGLEAHWRHTLSISEAPRYLVGKRLQQIRQRGAAAGLDEGLDRHSRNDLEAAKSRYLVVRNVDTNGVIGRLVVRVFREVGGDPAYGALELRRGSLIEGGEAKDTG